MLSPPREAWRRMVTEVITPAESALILREFHRTLR